ncbi:MAG: V-type ATP synthase subunit F [Candidatus Verstraetearchaeota archaeon]|nr:V-type ATP synthase subunit F [Candidatus Verstraetearchaeota archaeon]
MKIFFVGNPQLVDGYKFAGVDVVPVASDDELLKAVQSLVSREDAGIVLIDSDYTSTVRDKIERLKIRSKLPVLIDVPGRKSGAGVDLKGMISRIMGVKV